MAGSGAVSTRATGETTPGARPLWPGAVWAGAAWACAALALSTLAGCVPPPVVSPGPGADAEHAAAWQERLQGAWHADVPLGRQLQRLSLEVDEPRLRLRVNDEEQPWASYIVTDATADDVALIVIHDARLASLRLHRVSDANIILSAIPAAPLHRTTP